MKLKVVVLAIISIVVFSCQNKKKQKNQTSDFILPTKEVKKADTLPDFQNGDIIFQTSTSSQSKAIQLATHSIFSHVGIVHFSQKDSSFYVFEAVQPVKKTAIKEWINHGKNGYFVLKRLKNSQEIFTPKGMKKLKKAAKLFKGKSYDSAFEWNDDKMYCSELVWKMYKNAFDIELGKTQELGSFDLSNELVKTKLKERYGDSIPLQEQVISPVAIYNSELLETIFEN